MNYEEFSENIDVQSFVKWSSNYLNNINEKISYRKERKKLKMNSFDDGVTQYQWRGKDLDKTIEECTEFTNNLVKGINDENENLLYETCKEILQWGLSGYQLKQNIKKLDMKLSTPGLTETFNDIRKRMNLNLADLNNLDGIVNTAGFTKIYSFSSDDGLVIYDTRVAAILGYLVVIWARNKNNNEIPKILRLHQAKPYESNNTENPKIRKLKQLPTMSEKYRTIDSIKATWLMKLILKQNTILQDVEDHQEKMRKFEMGLFMLGYDLRQLKDFDIDMIKKNNKPGKIKKRDQTMKSENIKTEEMSSNLTSKIETIIKNKFNEVNNSEKIPLLNQGSFTAKLVEKGIEVDKLGSSNKLLFWDTFVECVRLIQFKGNDVIVGEAQSKARLGDKNIPLDSIEGYIALTVFNKKIGQSITRRFTYFGGILRWADIIEVKRGGSVRLLLNLD